MTDSAGGSQRCARVGAPGRGGGGRSASETRWRRHIVGQLKHRDLSQHAKFQDLIRFYTQLLEKSSLTKGLLSRSARRPSADSSCSVSSLKKTTGELAYRVLELQQQIKVRERLLDEQHARLLEEERRLEGALDARQALRGRVEQVQADNGTLKAEYDALLERQRAAETRLRDETLREGRLLQDVIQLKQQAAERLNSRNERKSRAREAKLQELQAAARSKVTMDSCRPSSPETAATPARGHTRLFRSASATSPRILSSFRELFDRKRRGHSVCSPEEELVFPVRICLSARVPARALQVLVTHTCTHAHTHTHARTHAHTHIDTHT
ncbi:protein Atg16l2 isoform X1 [Perca fluviatilis]|uniref:protein Atg16l2 isoform X1 n=1 Tax=Perca fluviatilis TaxID=8168 RepID=UPI0019656DFB|nr:protein Atg16l2 isoform X1 [Perca fluviatilis]